MKPKTKRKIIQEKHEEAVCKEFIILYDKAYSFVRHGDDKREADCLFIKNSELLAVELATTYYNDQKQAKYEWGIACGQKQLNNNESFTGIVYEPDKNLIERIQAEINDKCQKVYNNASRFILLIETRACLHNVSAIKKCIKSIVIPKKNPFSDIFVIHNAPLENGGGYRLYPVL